MSFKNASQVVLEMEIRLTTMWTLGQLLSISGCLRSCYDIACLHVVCSTGISSCSPFFLLLLFLNKKFTRGSVHFPDGSSVMLQYCLLLLEICPLNS